MTIRIHFGLVNEALFEFVMRPSQHGTHGLGSDFAKSLDAFLIRLEFKTLHCLIRVFFLNRRLGRILAAV